MQPCFKRLNLLKFHSLKHAEHMKFKMFLYLISSVSGTLVYGSMALARRLSSTGWKENESL